MERAAYLPLPYPEAAVVAEETLNEQNLALAAALPERPLVLGGCCCAHIGAVEALAARYGRLAVVWLDAHGDLNTPETSPSGNAWGMPLRMLLDSETIDARDTVLLGARSLDPPEQEFISSSGVRIGDDRVEAALEGPDAVYVAVDCDVFDPREDVLPFMPEPGGVSIDDATETLARVAALTPIAGAGFSGLRAAPANGATLIRLSAALGM